MKILKYKKKPNGKYSIFLDDGREFVYYEEVILKFDLLLKKEIREEDILTIHNANLEYDVYYVALNSIKSRYKSIYELRMFLKKKEYPEELIDKAILKLQEQKYLDDRLFAKSYIHSQMSTTSHGPGRIRRDLEDKKISSDIISDELEVFDDDLQREKIQKLIEKALKSNHSRGGYVLMQKITNDLNMQGYEHSLVLDVISNYSFDSSKEIAKKEYDKLYRKYSGKYQGAELKNKIREKMYAKGLKYEED